MDINYDTVFSYYGTSHSAVNPLYEVAVIFLGGAFFVWFLRRALKLISK